jgi:hypothetical protein
MSGIASIGLLWKSSVRNAPGSRRRSDMPFKILTSPKKFQRIKATFEEAKRRITEAHGCGNRKEWSDAVIQYRAARRRWRAIRGWQ